MRILIAPDKFKLSLSAPEVAAAVAQGIRSVHPHAEVDLVPMADGGEGTVDALLAAGHGERLTADVTGPLPTERVTAAWALLPDQTAVLEMSAASGLALLSPTDRNPEQTTTFGTGELINHAIERGARRIIVGIGGSATTDGGVGCAQACGWRFELDDGSTRGPEDRPINGGEVARVKSASQAARAFPPILVASDVDNPLYGPRGAARVFGPQKGATPQQVERLDGALARLATLLGRQDLAQCAGAGAAGGLGFGLMAFFDARLESGFGLVARTLRLRERIVDADLVITGEGRLDASSFHGKTAIGVARLCRQLKIPCLAIVGSVGPGAEAAQDEGLHQWHAIRDLATSDEDSMHRARALVVQVAERIARDLNPGTLQLPDN